ncbi:MAG: thiamine pyrophosphate-binding protein [Candidatus Roizmanbacteria bacterium]|nr:thiamine pyrophosphate-binding protein [Candidatus Roizmanbacteria bacterium]
MGQRVKISDVVVSEIVKCGVDTFFGVTGGAAVHFFDSIEKIPGVKSIFLNHEQAAAFAVESYAKARKSLGAGIFTTGPGATNALTGLAAAWLDSIPCILISGQVRSNQTVRGRPLRQVGTQEVDVVAMVKSMTKYAVTVYDIREVKYHVQKAIFLATHGRPGPVWLDIPVDISWSFIDSDELLDFVPGNETDSGLIVPALVPSKVTRVAELIRLARRPVVVAGYGVRLSGGEAALKNLIEKYNLPFVSSWNLPDWIPSDHPLNLGRPGLSGQRGANMALQNCDLIVAVGSHLNATIVGTRPEYFAREAHIVVVDVDANEIEHCPLGLEVAVNADAQRFCVELDGQLSIQDFPENPYSDWLVYCSRYKALNRIALDYENNRDRVNSYYFKYLLSTLAKPGDLFVADGGGTIVYSSFQSIETKEAQRLLLSTGLCSMGSGIPEAIGAHFALPERRIYCFIGDGSLPFNMQELQIITDLRIPILLFVFNNDGYVSIRTTQNDFLERRVVGSSPSSGLHLPKVKNIAQAFDLPYVLIDTQENLEVRLGEILRQEGPLFCEVMVSPDQEIVPRQGFSQRSDGTFEPRPIEDMYPFLDRELFQSLMIVPTIDALNITLIGREIDLMKSYPKSKRPIEQRFQDKQSRTGYVGLNEYGNVVSDLLFEHLILEKARTFGETYFDGDRYQGYGGYSYDIKYWRGVAKDIIAAYHLKAGDRVLEVGCAKGFLLHDLQELLPGLVVVGIDISEYAVSRALPSVKSSVSIGDAQALQFPDHSFDLVLSINTLSELPIHSCRPALTEISRVSRGRSFITLNSWRNRREKDQLLKWNLTALSNFSVSEWKSILQDVGYVGDYYWFFAS